MIKVTTNISETSVKLEKWVSQVGGAGRRMIYNRAAYHVANLVRRHLLRLGSWKHIWAERLGAQPTGFLQDAGRKTTSHASENGGEVIIPAPLGRAFHDVEIRPKRWEFLTIPASREAYGMRAAALAALGWQIFRAGKKKALMGRLSKDDAPKMLYYLATSVRQRQDRSLLPSDDEIKTTAADAMMAVIRKAR